MSILLCCLGIILFVTTPTAVALSNCICVGCWGHSISIRVLCDSTHLRVVINKEANHDSAGDDITNLIICAIVSTAPLKAGIGTFSERHM